MLLFGVILALSFIGGFVLPWWFVAIAAFASAFFIKTGGSTFWIGFAAVSIAWLALAMLKTFPNEHILANRMAQLFHLPNWVFIWALTGLIGGLVGGFATTSGTLTRAAINGLKKAPQSK